MGRSLLPWIALAVVVLAALAYFVREPSRADVGLDVLTASASGPASTSALELAGNADPARAPAALDAGARQDVAMFAEEMTGAFRAVARSRSEFRAGVIEVRVVHDEDGRPFAGARVKLPVGFDVTVVTEPPAQTTNAQGLARFEGLAEWGWEVVVEADGCVAERASGVIQEHHPEARVELRLATRREVLVRFVDASGRDLAPADLGLEADDVRGVGLVLDARCGEPGQRYTVGDAPSHRARSVDSRQLPFRWNVEIRGVAPACVHALLGDVILAVEPLDPRSTEALVRIDRDTVARAAAPVVVRVVNGATEEPVAGARVIFRPAGRKDVERVADAEGRARVEGLVTGEVGISASAPGFALARIAARRPIEGELVIRLSPGRAISGLVFDQRDAPMPRAVVGLYSAEEAGSSRVATPIELARTDLDGRFSFRELKGARYVVGVHAGDGRRRLPKLGELPVDLASADCRDGDVADIALRGYRPVNVIIGPDWDPPQRPR